MKNEISGVPIGISFLRVKQGLIYKSHERERREPINYNEDITKKKREQNPVTFLWEEKKKSYFICELSKIDFSFLF